MNHYDALPEFPNYDRHRDPHMQRVFRRQARSPARMTLTGDRITKGHLAKTEWMRAIRLDRHGCWRNPTPKPVILKHGKFASKSCVDCDSGAYCRCPIRDQLADEITDATSPYSREGQPPSPSHTAFRNVSRAIFKPEVVSRPGSAPLGAGTALMRSPMIPSPGMPPLLSDAILAAGVHAARRHIARDLMCGGGCITTEQALQPKRRPGTVPPPRQGFPENPWMVDYPPPMEQEEEEEIVHPGLKKPSPFRRCI